MAGNVTGVVQTMAADNQSGYILIDLTNTLVFFNTRNAAPGAGNIIVGAHVAFDFPHKSQQSTVVKKIDGQNVVSFVSVDGGPAGTGQAVNISVI